MDVYLPPVCTSSLTCVYVCLLGPALGLIVEMASLVAQLGREEEDLSDCC